MKTLNLLKLGLTLPLLTTACASMSSLQTAKVLEKGKSRSTYGGGYYSSPSLSGTGSDLKVPYFEYSYREGLGKDFDAGLKLTVVGTLSLDGKYQLVKGDAFDFSVGAGLGYMNISSSSSSSGTSSSTSSSTTVVDLILPVYASYKFSDQLSFYVSPRYIMRNSSGASSSTSNLAGGALGFQIGKDWGAFVETGYQKQLGGTFDAIQYNLSLFFNSDQGLLGKWL